MRIPERSSSKIAGSCAFAASLAAFLLLLSCSGGGTGPPATLTDLGTLQDLQEAFNRDAGVPRPERPSRDQLLGSQENCRTLVRPPHRGHGSRRRCLGHLLSLRPRGTLDQLPSDSHQPRWTHRRSPRRPQETSPLPPPLTSS